MPDTMMQPEAPAYENRSASLAKLAEALCKAQGAMEGATKDSVNPHFKNRYADLAAVWDAVRKPLAANGLSVIQFPRTVQQGVEIETTLLHSSGEFMRDTLWMPCSKNDAQGIGSAITYGRRYALMSVCGIAPVDDDGEAAVASTPRNASPPPPRNSSAHGRELAADEPHLIDNSRPKGTMPKAVAPADKAGDAKRKAKEWATDMTIDLNESEKTVDQLRDMEETNRQKLDWMQSNVPEAFDKFYTAFTNAIERATKREAA
jgi:hypothetical protein